MSKCKNCNINIMDDTDHCPLCNQVIEKSAEGVNKYPNLSQISRKLRHACNIILFLSIMLGSLLMHVDYKTGDHMLWSLVVVLILFYLNTIMRLTVAGKSGYQFKTVSTTILGILFLFGVDYLTGNHGWALSYVLPAAIIVVDVAILILMMVNHRNWQSYLMIQLIMILISLVPVILVLCDIITNPYVVMVANMASVFLFLGTLIIGDRKAREELKRRFHI